MAKHRFSCKQGNHSSSRKPCLIAISFTLFFFFSICLFNFELQAQNNGKEDKKSSDQSDTLYVKEMVLSKDVVERTPINRVQAFDVEDEEGWCFARIYNDGPMRSIQFKWYYEGEPYYTFDAKVGTSKKWRTYSSVTLREGSWRVEIIGPNDEILKEVRFHVSG